jgi:hypothetical protein
MKEPAMIQQGPSAYVQACRARIPQFVSNHYTWRGAWRLNRLAWGWDIARAPLNFILGFPNFLLRLLALLFEGIRLHRMAHRLRHCHLGVDTRVQRHLLQRLKSDLLDLPEQKAQINSQFLHQIAEAAEKPLQLYVQTRNVAAYIRAGTIAATLGVIFFNQFTPGSISAGSVIAKELAREQAISEFLLGEIAGKLYYTLFPPAPGLGIIVISLLGIMVLIALVAAFSGILHDPIQSSTGLHQHRLHRFLDAIESSACDPTDQGYRPKDTFFGRIYDLIDWIKGLFTYFF